MTEFAVDKNFKRIQCFAANCRKHGKKKNGLRMGEKILYYCDRHWRVTEQGLDCKWY